ncbi:Reverse transcriptase zinc-binding domain [Sesbania bispinosa]|nr:Reverse transcriptase zinc-binding domain [Sesbania bispinosa]
MWEEGSSSGSRIPEFNWKKLWSILSQPKFLHFIWRLMHNSLPVKANLLRRGIHCEPLCPCCSDDLETEKDNSLLPYVMDFGMLGSSVPSPRVSWAYPTMVFYKANVDAAHAVGDVWGIGIVVQDYKGYVLVAAAKHISTHPDPRLAEGMGIRLATHFCFGDVF